MLDYDRGSNLPVKAGDRSEKFFQQIKPQVRRNIL
jgi:hypothetical protein